MAHSAAPLHGPAATLHPTPLWSPPQQCIAELREGQNHDRSVGHRCEEGPALLLDLLGEPGFAG